MSEPPPDIQELTRACDELRMINNLIDRICRVRETNHILQIIISSLVRFTDSDQGVINLVEPSEGQDLVTVVRKSAGDSSTLPYKLDQMISGRALHEQSLVRVDDLDADERFPGASSEDGRFKSIVCCPMLTRGEAVGLLTLVRSHAKPAFREDECRVVGVVASQSAQILSNALLLEELAEKNELLQLSQQKLHEENLRLRSEVRTHSGFENIIGKSPAMKQVLAVASKVSNTDAPVLVTGPTGTGKELIARAIHFQSARKDKPFVVKNCSVKTESLLEAELFGHVKGAFTGADRDRPGLFKEADGGTVFLDEVGDAPLSTQAAILRVLETGEIRPVGAGRTDHVDVRIISATNRILSDAIARETFRRDLYYRLNTFTIELPSLRERAEDIPLLVRHFLRRLGVKLGIPELTITPAALEILLGYPWPGNVRQLENEIERAAVVSEDDGVIDVADLSPSIRSGELSATTGPLNSGNLKERVEALEREAIRAGLADNRGNILQTAKALGLTRKGLRDKMTRYSIEANSSQGDSASEA